MKSIHFVISANRSSKQPNRFFRPSTSDDASHDEALSSQVASLNMLDLSLAHLGVEVPAGAENGIEEVVKQCGQGMSRPHDR